MKDRLEKIPTTGRSEAAAIRDAIRVATQDTATPRPRAPLMDRGLGDVTIATDVDALLGEELGPPMS